MRRDSLWLLGAFLVAIGASSCSSDSFGPTGSSLPAEVSQDSLGVLISITGAVEEAFFVPPLEQPLEDRELLYLGQKQSSGWRATPLLRFDIASVLDTLDAAVAALVTTADSVSRWRSVRLDLNLRTGEQNAGILRDIELYDLVDTLAVSMLESDLAAVQGGLLETLNGRNASLALDLDPDVVFAWIDGGGHRGVALVDRTDPAPDNSLGNLVAFLSQNTGIAVDRPEVILGLPDPRGLVDEIFVAFPVLLDFTLFETPDESDALALGSHLAARPWLRFDLSPIPPSASVNGATLTLCLDPERSLMNSELFYSAYVRDRAAAESGETPDDALIFGSSDVLFPDQIDVISLPDTVTVAAPPRSFEIDVTEFVQRAVNGVFDPAFDGISVVGALELFELQRLVVFDSSAPVDTLKPRLDVIFTPPVDFEE